MSDIYCSKCGEPWDAYGIYDRSDMTDLEACRFLVGEGCPSCHWGTECPLCSGSGVDTVEGCTCYDRRVMGWRPARDARGYRSDRWYAGYTPDVRELPGDLQPIRQLAGHESADGWVYCAIFPCPDCLDAEPERIVPCVRCGGSGALKVEEGADIKAAESEIDASDLDPIEILHRRGIR